MRGPRPYSPEPVDPATVSPSGPQRAIKQAGLVLLCLAYVLLGLIGHDPWKTEDALTFGVAWEMLQRGDFIVPHLAHIPWFDRGPLVSLLSAGTLALLSPPLEPFDAARVASGIVLVLILALVAWTGRELNGRAMRWMPVLILVGSIGLFDRGHQLSPELALAMAVALALYGLAVALRRPLRGGALLGLAIGVGFLARGWLGPLWIGVAALAMPLAGEPWRGRPYAITLAIAAIVAIPLCAAWPLALASRSPAALDGWLAAERLSDYLPFLPDSAAPDPLYFVRNVVWFAWPSLPLLAWTLWIRGRGFNGGLREPGIEIPGVMAIVVALGLALMPDPRLIQMLPILVPLALIASIEIDSLHRGHSAALDWFGMLTFGLTAVVVWGFWVDAYLHGMSPSVARLLRDTEMGYVMSFKLWAVVAAVLLTILWIALVRPARRSNRRALLNWAAGVTLIWGLSATIWLPYIDSRRTYRNVAEAIAARLPQDGCVASRNLGDPQRALFYYFAGVVTVPEDARPANDCSTLLVQYGRVDASVPALDGYRLMWQGARRGDDTERFAVYRKETP